MSKFSRNDFPMAPEWVSKKFKLLKYDYIIYHFVFWLMNSVCPSSNFELDFKATIKKQHINQAELFYKSSNDSAKMAVYLSSS